MVKTKATVNINNMKINYYQQLIFRLVNWITCSILPLVSPDEFPTDNLEIKKRMTDFYKTSYVVELTSSSIYLKPNYLSKKYLKVGIPYIEVVNNVEKLGKRGLSRSNKNENFWVESIDIEIRRLKIFGTD